MTSTCRRHGYTSSMLLWPSSARLYHHFMKAWTCPELTDWHDLFVMRDKVGLTASCRIRTWWSPGKPPTRCWFPCWFLRWDVTQTGCDQWTGCESPNWAHSSNSIIVEDSAGSCALVTDTFVCVHVCILLLVQAIEDFPHKGQGLFSFHAWVSGMLKSGFDHFSRFLIYCDEREY